VNSWGGAGGGKARAHVRLEAQEDERGRKEGRNGGDKRSSHLQGAHVPQHHVADPLVVALDVSVGATLPAE